MSSLFETLSRQLKHREYQSMVQEHHRSDGALTFALAYGPDFIPLEDEHLAILAEWATELGEYLESSYPGVTYELAEQQATTVNGCLCYLLIMAPVPEEVSPLWVPWAMHSTV